jgi:hypothetical protein
MKLAGFVILSFVYHKRLVRVIINFDKVSFSHNEGAQGNKRASSWSQVSPV